MKKLTLGFTALILTAFTANADSFTTTHYVKVEKSKPKYENIIHRTPHEERWVKRVPVRRYKHIRNQHRRYNSRYDGFGTLIGGVAGGILGNQVGRGRGRAIATIGGALIGSLVGNSLARRNYNDNSYSYTTWRTNRRWAKHHNRIKRRRFVGYKNIGFYRGHKIVSYSQRRLNYIPLR